MKNRLIGGGVVLLGCLVITCGVSFQAFASVDYNHLIDDQVFDTSDSMTASQINSFLNSFSGSCISTNAGFSAPDPTGYNPTAGFIYGSNVSAGQVIADAATAYQINPQVLLATTQKEQSLVTGSGGCTTLGYVGAMGYGCPDGGTTHNYSGLDLYSLNGTKVTSVNGTCVSSNQEVGFSQQIIHAAWLLKFDRERSEGVTTWEIISGNWDNSDDPGTCYEGFMIQGNYARCSGDPTTPYDGTATIDGQGITIANGATAALYDYTPHLSGNSNFVTIFDDWFGSTYTPAFAWEEISLNIMDAGQNSTIPTDYMHNGDRLYVILTAENIGSSTWYNSGSNPMRLGTQYPQDSYTPYCDITWTSCNRAATLSESSVAPGAIGHFDFYMAVPNKLGAYRYYFEPVAENQSWMSNGSGFNIYVDNTGQYDWQPLYYDAYTDSTKTTPVDINNVAENEQMYIVYYVKNISAQTWYNYGPNPADLGTADPENGTSILCTTGWLSCDRPATMDQSSVAPGQIATFSFPVKAPGKIGQYREYFKPVLEFKGWTDDKPYEIYLNVNH